MKSPLCALLACLAFAPIALAGSDEKCAADCCKTKESCCAEENKTTDAKRYPLRGVITAVHSDKSAVMVKHEEIPGVMPAMTMLFKVDAAVLKSARKGAKITAVMERQGEDWWLQEVKPARTPSGT